MKINNKITDDTSSYFHDTEKKVYLKIRDKLIYNLSSFEEVLISVVDQFDKEYRNKYGGYEWIGSGVSQAGSSFSISDLAIVDLVFAPAIKAKYKKEGIRFIEDIVKQETSKNNPSFLKRSSVPVLIDELSQASSKNYKQSKKLLGILLNEVRGIPSTKDIIYQAIRNAFGQISDDDCFDMVKAGLNIKRDKILPSNVFAVQIIFMLINKKYKKAEILFFEILKNPKYFKYDDSHFETIENIQILKDRPEIKEKILLAFLENNSWLNQKKKMHIFDKQQAFDNYVLSKIDQMKEIDLAFLQKIIDKKGRGKDQRINLVFKSLPRIVANDPIKIYDFIIKNIGNKRKINKFITEKYAREQVVECAIALSKHKDGKYDTEVFSIIRLFKNDPDPANEEQYEGNPEFNYSKKVRDGKDAGIITTVRGRIPWAMQELATRGGNYPGILDLWKEMLFKEKNLYIVQQLVVPMIIFIANRKAIIENRLGESKYDCFKQLILSDKMLKYAKFPAIRSLMINAYSNLRDVNEEEAKRIYNSFSKDPESSFFLLYFAVYRKNHFKEDGKFKPNWFKKELIKVIKNDPNKRKNLILQFEHILRDNKDTGFETQFNNLKPYLAIAFKTEYDENPEIGYVQVIEFLLEKNGTLYKQGYDWLKELIFRFEKGKLKIGDKPFTRGLLYLGGILEYLKPKDKKEVINLINKLKAKIFIHFR